ERADSISEVRAGRQESAGNRYDLYIAWGARRESQRLAYRQIGALAHAGGERNRDGVVGLGRQDPRTTGHGIAWRKVSRQSPRVRSRDSAQHAGARIVTGGGVETETE